MIANSFGKCIARGFASATVKTIKGRRLPPTKAPLVLTPAAVKRAKELLDGHPDAIGLKVGVKQRGCNGLSYTLDYTSEKKKLDEEVIQDGVKIVIDSRALLTLLGTEMDFVESEITSEFVFHNPNINGTCGCGESFSI